MRLLKALKSEHNRKFCMICAMHCCVAVPELCTSEKCPSLNITLAAIDLLSRTDTGYVPYGFCSLEQPLFLSRPMIRPLTGSRHDRPFTVCFLKPESKRT